MHIGQSLSATPELTGSVPSQPKKVGFAPVARGPRYFNKDIKMKKHHIRREPGEIFCGKFVTDEMLTVTLSFYRNHPETPVCAWCLRKLKLYDKKNHEPRRVMVRTTVRSVAKYG